MTLEVLEHGFDIGDARGDGGIAAEPARLAAAPEVEAGEGEAGLRKVLGEQEVLVAVLGGAHAMAGDHAGRGLAPR